MNIINFIIIIVIVVKEAQKNVFMSTLGNSGVLFEVTIQYVKHSIESLNLSSFVSRSTLYFCYIRVLGEFLFLL